MSEVDAAMLEHMKYIVEIEARPFSYLDFETFKVGDREYHIAHGTCRNKFSELVKAGIIELEYNSKVAFYTLKGHHFPTSNKMTHNGMGISSVTDVTHVSNISNNMNSMTDLFSYIHSIPIDKTAVHDIHYKFVVPDIIEGLLKMIVANRPVLVTMHYQNQYDKSKRCQDYCILTGYITVLCVSYKDNLNCRPVKFNSPIIYWDELTALLVC